jgi:hypothetical protein
VWNTYAGSAILGRIGGAPRYVNHLVLGIVLSANNGVYTASGSPKFTRYPQAVLQTPDSLKYSHRPPITFPKLPPTSEMRVCRVNDAFPPMPLSVSSKAKAGQFKVSITICFPSSFGTRESVGKTIPACK